MQYPTRLLAVTLSLSLALALFGFSPASTASGVTPLQQLYVMKELKPGIQRIGIVWDKNVDHEAVLAQIQRASTAAGVKVVVAAVTDVKELGPMFRDLVRGNQIDALWIVDSDQVVDSDLGRRFLIKSAAEHGIPLFAPSEQWVSQGAAIAVQKNGDAMQLVVNRVAAQAAALAIPDKYAERTQFVAAN